MLSKNIVLILKCTRSCNLLCRYCRDRRSSFESIQFSILVPLIKDILNHNDIESVKFVFHGGEPLLLGQPFFEKIIAVQKLTNKRGINIKNTIQTNGTLINPQWCGFFASNNIQVGISLDGPEHIHNLQRPFLNMADGNSFAMSINGIRLLKEYNIQFGVLTVVTESLAKINPTDFFNFFLGLSVDNLSLLLLQPSMNSLSQRKNEYIEYLASYADFLCSVSNLLLKYNNPNIRIREITSKIDSLLGNSPSVCTEGGFCAGKYFGVDINGDIGLCDSFFNKTDFTFGNLHNNNITEVITGLSLDKTTEIEDEIRNKCSHCKWFPICVGGCLFDALIYFSELSHDRERYCPNRKIYSYLSKEIYEELSPLLKENNF